MTAERAPMPEASAPRWDCRGNDWWLVDSAGEIVAKVSRNMVRGPYRFNGREFADLSSAQQAAERSLDRLLP